MSTLNTVPAAPRKLLVSTVYSSSVSDASWMATATALDKSGITSEMCAPAYKETNASFYNDLRGAIVEGLDTYVEFLNKAKKETSQTLPSILLNSPTKGLSEEDKQTKRYWQQQIGSKQARLVKYLKKLEGFNNKGDTDKTAKTTAHKAAEYLLRAIRALEPKDGNLSGLPVGYKLSVHKELLKKEYTALAGKPYKSADD